MCGGDALRLEIVDVGAGGDEGDGVGVVAGEDDDNRPLSVGPSISALNLHSPS